MNQRPPTSNPTPRRVIVEFLLTGSIGRSRLQGLFNFLRGRRKWDIRLPQTEADLNRELAFHPDGVIVSHSFSKRTMRSLERFPSPVVFVDIPRNERFRRRDPDISIHNDNGEVGMMAARYLLSIGKFNDFGYFPYWTPRFYSTQRGKAFKSVLARSGHTASVFQHGGAIDLETWLRRLRKPAAVFAAWDEGAREVLAACHRAKIRVPGQICLLGVDNDELVCTLASPDLSSIDLGAEQEGFLAAKELDGLMLGHRRSRSKTMLVKPRGVVERASTKAPPPAAHLVNEAMTFIASHAKHALTPADVAKHVRCSRRLLDLRFGEINGETVQSAITRTRLETVRNLLRTSPAQLTSIARECAFSSPAALNNLFRRTYGMSMRDFRKQAGIQRVNARPSCSQPSARSPEAASSSRPKSAPITLLDGQTDPRP